MINHLLAFLGLLLVIGFLGICRWIINKKDNTTNNWVKKYGVLTDGFNDNIM